MHASASDRLIGASGAAVAVALMVAMLLFGMTVQVRARAEPSLTLVELQPPTQPHQPQAVRQKSARASGRASPRNRRNKAAEIVAPPPPLSPPPIPLPMMTAILPGAGMAASAGASDRPGSGQGAGGRGDGTGGGGYGDGDGGDDVPPVQVRGRPLKFTQLPPDLRSPEIGGTVDVRYSVNVDGSVSECSVTGSSGNPELDRATCELIERRFRFRPARDPDGRPVRSTIEESHSWIIERPDDPAPRR